MKIMMTMFGWNDVGGGTSYPRQIAVDLVKEGHEVLVFYAAVHEQIGPHKPTTHRLIYHHEDGVQLVAVQDRPSLFLGIREPDSEMHHADIIKSYKIVFNDFQPDIVHYHNFLGLSLGLIDIAYQAGIPSIFSAHNFWMICPTLYLWLPQGGRCQGIDTRGVNCQSCSQSYSDPWHLETPSPESYLQRQQLLLSNFKQKVNYGLVNSKCVHELFVKNGYDKYQIRIQKLSNPRSERIWKQVGEIRSLEVPTILRIGFIGQVIPMKGVHILVAAAQLLEGAFEIHIHGVTDPQYLNYLQALDKNNHVIFHGSFNAEEQLALLKNLDLGVVTSVWFEHSALVITELLGAKIPVIGADIGGIPDYLQKESCLTYPAEDHHALAKILQDLLDNRDKIKKMKKKIRPPESPRVYLNSILNYYQELQTTSLKPEHPLYEQRKQSFLAQRTKSQVYHSQRLKSISIQQPSGLDIHQIQDLNELSSELQTAQWVTSPSIEVINSLSQQQITASFLPFLRPEAQSAPSKETISLQEQTILIFITADDGWKTDLLNCKNQAWAQKLTWIFLPWEIYFQTGQDHLITFLEEQSEDFEFEMELLELNDNQEITSILNSVDCLILPKEHNLKLRYLALEANQMIYSGDPNCLQELFKKNEANNLFKTCAKTINGDLFKPLHDSAKDHNQAVLNTLNKILG